MSVRILLVSHSAQVARGVAALAAEVAGAVTVVPLGGTADGTLGTDPDALARAVREALDVGDEVVVLADLGSAVLAAKTVLDDEDEADRAVLADAPFVEGALAAAVTASTGAGLAEVVAQAELARELRKR